MAAGFGTGTVEPEFHHEIASSVPYQTGDREELRARKTQTDEEAPPVKSSSSSNSNSVGDPSRIVTSDTPFFHVDLQAAVQAAEREERELEKS